MQKELIFDFDDETEEINVEKKKKGKKTKNDTNNRDSNRNNTTNKKNTELIEIKSLINELKDLIIKQNTEQNKKISQIVSQQNTAITTNLTQQNPIEIKQDDIPKIEDKLTDTKSNYTKIAKECLNINKERKEILYMMFNSTDKGIDSNDSRINEYYKYSWTFKKFLNRENGIKRLTTTTKRINRKSRYILTERSTNIINEMLRIVNTPFNEKMAAYKENIKKRCKNETVKICDLILAQVKKTTYVCPNQIYATIYNSNYNFNDGNIRKKNKTEKPQYGKISRCFQKLTSFGLITSITDKEKIEQSLDSEKTYYRLEL